MNIPEDLQYTPSHEWVRTLPDGSVEIGLTDYAQKELGDLVFANLPQEGDELAAGEPFADVESVKAVSDIYSPVSGTVQAVHEELLDSPQLINENPYGAWFVRVANVTGTVALMDGAAYREHLK